MTFVLHYEGVFLPLFKHPYTARTAANTAPRKLLNTPPDEKLLAIAFADNCICTPQPHSTRLRIYGDYTLEHGD